LEPQTVGEQAWTSHWNEVRLHQEHGVDTFPPAEAMADRNISATRTNPERRKLLGRGQPYFDLRIDCSEPSETRHKPARGKRMGRTDGQAAAAMGLVLLVRLYRFLNAGKCFTRVRE